jgi:hypothetical protein
MVGLSMLRRLVNLTVGVLVIAGSLHAKGPDSPVVINEVCAVGGDWIEMHNSGRKAVDISNWKLADSEADGSARLKDALSFPRGTIMPARGYLLVVSEGGKNKTKRQDLCSDKGAGACFHVKWGIDKDKGEILRLFALDGSVASAARYPAGVVPKDHTWARQPDGSGEFKVAKPTPGRPGAVRR